MQPLGTKINHATSQDKKNHATQRKKLCNFFGQKKNLAISRDNKITQSFETKKKSCKL